MIFKLKRLELTVKVDYSFILILSFSLMSGERDILILLLFSAVHEVSHLITLYLLGGKADLLKLSFYGAAIKYSCKLGRMQELFVILSGPASNLVLFLLLKDKYNLVLFIFNILPIYPLDGGRALRIFFPNFTDALTRVLLIILLILALYLFIFMNSVSMLLIVIYLFLFNIHY